MFLFLIYFAFQPLASHLTAEKSLVIDTYQQDALAEAKIKGYFTATDLQKIQQQIAMALSYSTTNVTVSGTTTPTPRGQLISLTVEAPAYFTFYTVTGNNQVLLGGTKTAASEALTP